MTINEALEELSRRYPDRYVSVSYTIDRYIWQGKRRDDIVCTVFRGAGNDPMGQISKGRTWKEALENLDPPTIPVQEEPCDDGESILDHERREDARLEAAEVRKEMREARKI